jgi:hypothetical protein
MARVLSLAPSTWMLRTLADVAYMLSDGGRHPIFEKDIVALCEKVKPHHVRVALHWSTLHGELLPHPTLSGAFVASKHLLGLAARHGGFPDAA